MNELMNQLKTANATAFTHNGKFHADDVFSSALLFYINPEITILRGSQVPEDFEGVVFDIGRGRYDHHQRDSRIRENGVPYAAFGLLWEALGADILGEELAVRFDEEFIQPLDNNDNTGEKNELATLIGNFNLSWDEEGSNDEAFFQAVNVAGMILENKFSKYRGNERADKQVEEYLTEYKEDHEKILIMPQFVPCQKKLSETDIEFVIFPSNRGGYCIQPQKKEYSMNYKCSFPAAWLGLEKEELQKATGLASASFCHKGGFLMTVGELEDAVEACKISQKQYVDEPVIVVLSTEPKQKRLENQEKEHELNQLEKNEIISIEKMLHTIPNMAQAVIKEIPFPQLPEFSCQGSCGEVLMEKSEWKQYQKDFLKKILVQKPEAVYIDGDVFAAYPIVHLLRKKKVPVLTMVEKDGRQLLVRIPSGS